MSEVVVALIYAFRDIFIAFLNLFNVVLIPFIAVAVVAACVMLTTPPELLFKKKKWWKRIFQDAF